MTAAADVALLVHSNENDGKSFFVFPWKHGRFIVGASDVPFSTLADVPGYPAGNVRRRDVSTEYAFLQHAIGAYGLRMADGAPGRASAAAAAVKLPSEAVLQNDAPEKADRGKLERDRRPWWQRWFGGGGSRSSATRASVIEEFSSDGHAGARAEDRPAAQYCMQPLSSLMLHPDVCVATTPVMKEGYAVDASMLQEEGMVRVVGGSWLDTRAAARDVLAVLGVPVPVRPSPIPLSGFPTSSQSLEAPPVDSGSIAALRNYVRTEYGPSQREAVFSAIAVFNEARAGDSTVAAFEAGMRERQLPFALGEVPYMVEREFAQTVSDVVARRWNLAQLDPRLCDEVIPIVAETMGRQLSWSMERTRLETLAAREELRTLYMKKRSA